MRFFDLVNISERYIELANPSTPEKTVKFGKFLRLHENSRVIDFGCGYAEALVLWAERFGITGVDIEVREHACERARKVELLQIARQEGFDLEYVVRASHDDWDRYEADNWHGLVRWLEENPEHPDRDQVIEHLHEQQDEYLKYGREYIGWAMYVLAPRPY